MSIAATVRAMAAAGCSAEQIADVTTRMELERRAGSREGNARRQREFKARKRAERGNEGNAGNAENAVTSVTEAVENQPHILGEVSSPLRPLKGALSPQGTPLAKAPVEPRTRATRLPADWRPTEADRDFARDHGFAETAIDREVEKIINWSASSPKGACRDWAARWRNWILQAGPPPARAGPPPRRTNNALDFFNRPDHEHTGSDFPQDDHAPYAGVTIDG